MSAYLHLTTRLLALATCLTFALPAAAAEVAEPIPAEAFARTAEIQSVSMSADGKNLVALIASPKNKAEETALATWDINDIDKGAVVTESGKRMKFIGADALKANRVLVVGRQEWSGQISTCGGEGKSVGSTKTFINKVYLTDTKQEKFDEAFSDKVRKLGVGELTQRCMEIMGSASLVSRLPLDPDNVLIQQTDNGTLSSNYYLYNLRTDETKLMFTGNRGTSPGLFNPRNGEVITRTDIEPGSNGDYMRRILLLNPKTGEFEQQDKLTTNIGDRYSMNVIGIDENSGKFYVLTDRFSDHIQARVYDPETRDFDPQPLVAHPEYDIGGLVFGMQPSNFNQILGFVVNGPRPEVTWIDPKMKAIHDMLLRSFPGQTVALGDYNNDLSRLLFTTQSNRHPPTYHLLIDGKQVRTLGSQRPWIKPEQIGEQRWVNYAARDGLSIPAILDLPVGWDKSKGPLRAIVHPHGGPWARDYTGWDASGWVPFLTSRGYAVIRPQYRGSQGFGRKLWMAGDAEWGQKMQDDLDDAAKWLVDQGIADASHVSIFGYSYGGYAATAASVRPNGPFNCAIAGGPVTNLTKLGRSWSDNRLQRILQGRTVKGMDPIMNTDKVSIPIMLYVGDRDVRTPQFHAKTFYDAVKDHTNAEFHLIADMPHSMPWYHRHQIEALGLIETFLNDDCKARSSASQQ